MELTLKENYTILYLSTKKGMVVHTDTVFTTGLAAFILAELMQLRKIILKNDFVVLKDALHTGDDVLDHVLDLLDASDNDYNVKTWIERLTAKERVKELLDLHLGNMQKNSLVRLNVSYKFLFFGKELNYTLPDAAIRKELVTRLRSGIMAKNVTANEEDAMLIILLDCCRLFRLFIPDTNDRRNAGRRVRDLMAIPVVGDSNFFKALQTALREKNPPAQKG